jgi:hypothetical protein
VAPLQYLSAVQATHWCLARSQARAPPWHCASPMQATQSPVALSQAGLLTSLQPLPPRHIGQASWLGKAVRDCCSPTRHAWVQSCALAPCQQLPCAP